MRRLPDNRAVHAGFGTAFKLLDAFVDVVNRNCRDPEQTLGRHFAVIDQPIIVGAERDFLKLGIVHRKVGQKIRREKHFAAYAICFHLCDSVRWVRAAGMRLKARSDRQFRKTRHLIPKRLRRPFD